MNNKRCEQCGEPIPWYRYSNARYCSRECSNAARQDRRRKTGRRTGVRKPPPSKGHHFWMDPGKKAAIRMDVRSGMPQKAVARKHGVSQSTVSRVAGKGKK